MSVDFAGYRDMLMVFICVEKWLHIKQKIQKSPRKRITETLTLYLSNFMLVIHLLGYSTCLNNMFWFDWHTTFCELSIYRTDTRKPPTENLSANWRKCSLSTQCMAEATLNYLDNCQWSLRKTNSIQRINELP